MLVLDRVLIGASSGFPLAWKHVSAILYGVMGLMAGGGRDIG